MAWPVAKLGDVCQTGSGGTPLRSNKDYYEGGNIPWLMSGEVGQGEIHSVRQCITQLGLANSAAKIFPKETVVIAMYGATAGQVGLLKCESATNQAVCGILPNSRFNAKFLYYYFLSRQTHMIAQATGNAQPNISQVKIKNIDVPLAPLPEQRRIVSVLDEAFAGLDAMRANAEKNLQNARQLFEDYLRSVFSNDSTYESKSPATKRSKRHAIQSFDIDDPEAATRTGGRAATTRHIAGDFSLCVGMPKQAARQGWQWRALTDLARMESGHTPSRRHPEYWGGDVPWIGIRDAKRFHGAQVTATEESTNQFGLANSSARLLPAGTVCLSRTASVGYVTIMSRPMATSQDFVNWVCGNELDPHFLSFLFLAQGNEFFKFSSGAVHQTIYFPEAKAFHVCIPSLGQQRQIAMQADKLKQAAADLEMIYARKLAAIDELKQSILQKAFAGELTAAAAVAA